MKRIVAIDGPAGSGKGTIAKIIADKCNLIYVDTGVTYRCITLKMLENKIDISEKEKVIDIAKNIDIKFMDGKTYLDGIDVSDKIRSKEVKKLVSFVSSIIEVRKLMVELQRKMANDNNVIMEGRDITTVVLPNANYKFYLDASIEERAKRRLLQNKEKNIDMSYEEILENIASRDYNDMNKPVGALIRTDEQIYIDTTNMSIDEVVEKMINIIGSE